MTVSLLFRQQMGQRSPVTRKLLLYYIPATFYYKVLQSLTSNFLRNNKFLACSLYAFADNKLKMAKMAELVK